MKEGVFIDASKLEDAPHDLIVEVLDDETSELIFTQNINGLMYYYAENDGDLQQMPEVYKETKSLIIDFIYNSSDISSVLSEFTSLNI